MNMHDDPLNSSVRRITGDAGPAPSVDAEITSRLDEAFRARAISGAGLAPPAAFVERVARTRRRRSVRNAVFALAAVVTLSAAVVYFTRPALVAPGQDRRLTPEGPSRPIAADPDQSPAPPRAARPPEGLAINSRDPDQLAERSSARDADLITLRVGDRQRVLSGGIALLR